MTISDINSSLFILALSLSSLSFTVHLLLPSSSSIVIVDSSVVCFMHCLTCYSVYSTSFSTSPWLHKAFHSPLYRNLISTSFTHHACPITLIFCYICLIVCIGFRQYLLFLLLLLSVPISFHPFTLALL